MIAIRHDNLDIPKVTVIFEVVFYKLLELLFGLRSIGRGSQKRNTYIEYFFSRDVRFPFRDYRKATKLASVNLTLQTTQFLKWIGCPRILYLNSCCYQCDVVCLRALDAIDASIEEVSITRHFTAHGLDKFIFLKKPFFW